MSYMMGSRYLKDTKWTYSYCCVLEFQQLLDVSLVCKFPLVGMLQGTPSNTTCNWPCRDVSTYFMSSGNFCDFSEAKFIILKALP